MCKYLTLIQLMGEKDIVSFASVNDSSMYISDVSLLVQNLYSDLQNLI